MRKDKRLRVVTSSLILGWIREKLSKKKKNTFGNVLITARESKKSALQDKYMKVML